MNDGGRFPAELEIRDFFAAAALTGWLAMHADSTIAKCPIDDDAAKAAYEYADAMLAERAKKK